MNLQTLSTHSLGKRVNHSSHREHPCMSLNVYGPLLTKFCKWPFYWEYLIITVLILQMVVFAEGHTLSGQLLWWYFPVKLSSTLCNCACYGALSASLLCYQCLHLGTWYFPVSEVDFPSISHLVASDYKHNQSSGVSSLPFVSTLSYRIRGK